MVAPEPFVKWAGGKQALAVPLLTAFPRTFDRYLEPFVGGGALFFALRPARAMLADANEWLITTYAAIRDDWQRVVSELGSLVNTREEFLRLRSLPPEAGDRFTRAARFVHLNKTCFRGLFRVNRQGCFNVPYGAYQRRTHDPENLRAVAALLQGVDLRVGDFSETLADARDGDFVYLDPPYWKLGGHADFDRYTKDKFRAGDHQRLAELCRDLDRRGVRFVLSNSDTPFVRELFGAFTLTTIPSRREIHLDRRRRDASELVIRNYDF